MSDKIVPQNILAELLDLVGRDNMPVLEKDDVQKVLDAGVTHALKTHLDLMVGGASERTRAWIAKDWLDRSGNAPVQKIAIREHISFDASTLAALKAIAAEDEEDDPVIDVREAVVEDSGPGSGSDQGNPPPEVSA